VSVHAAHDPEYQALQSRYEESEKQEIELAANIQNKMAKKVIATEFFEKFMDPKKPVSKFDIDLWNGLLDHIEVQSPNDIRFLFRDGSEIKVDMEKEEKKRAPLEFVCQHCGKTFVAYGTKRKFCNRNYSVEPGENNGMIINDISAIKIVYLTIQQTVK
jgi:hypothetical protein